MRHLSNILVIVRPRPIAWMAKASHVANITINTADTGTLKASVIDIQMYSFHKNTKKHGFATIRINPLLQADVSQLLHLTETRPGLIRDHAICSATVHFLRVPEQSDDGSLEPRHCTFCSVTGLSNHVKARFVTVPCHNPVST